MFGRRSKYALEGPDCSHTSNVSANVKLFYGVSNVQGLDADSSDEMNSPFWKRVVGGSVSLQLAKKR